MGDNLGNCFKYLNTVKVRCSAFGIPNRTCISLQTSCLLHRRPREQRADDAQMLCGGEWDKTMSISIISMSLEKIIKEKNHALLNCLLQENTMTSASPGTDFRQAPAVYFLLSEWLMHHTTLHSHYFSAQKRKKKKSDSGIEHYHNNIPK